ncbi:chemotaxis protein CheY [Arthrobacter sp. ZBG10]|uniref:response regulator transcription factor n=1 Tax=Arthrobacter sp. ZBG10 TaxID=1676590 RepID=UPI000682E9FB|nr:response regulator transcription factor [Arthrobacter sp. ZBG10]KNH18282.1 chemotaxis protein CheY [Arthrobacter sp. ZBG10]
MAQRGMALVVEDDEETRGLLEKVLQQAGFTVHAVGTGQEAVAAVREFHPDVVTMDVGLPDFDGLEAVRRIRSFSDAYLIIISGQADEADALMGFETGADDYLVKPFSPRELRARIAALLRRPRSIAAVPAEAAGEGAAPVPSVPAAPGVPAAVADGPADLAHRGLTVDPAGRQAALDGQPVELSANQFDLLVILMENGRNVLTKAQLVRQLRQERADSRSFVSAGEERSLGAQVASLRQRLGDDSRQPRWLETVRGVGYRMTQ